ncbi:hypothetical protein [Cytobacillus purgationiresistens]|uniref:Uncharacterized protein n=1 Tax=Cytobacillus purgationiresistens TaxID=863449 RepID=A0ABU0AT65_9BACI|nr:hypothetical protein [Cytobacillus purgationiresistens]MDQ0273966.1 hypothetical protein [Cytobacillus purgationiresistens]
MAISGFKSQVMVTGKPVEFLNEGTLTQNFTTYSIVDRKKKIFSYEDNIKVEESIDGEIWSVIESGLYEVNRLKGEITFSEQKSENTTIRLSGFFLPLSLAGKSYEYTYSIEIENLSAPEFGSNYQKRLYGQKDTSGEILNWYETNNSLLLNALRENTTVVLQFYGNENDLDFCMWAILKTAEVSSTIGGLVEEAIEFEGTTDINGRMFSIE